MLCTRWLEPRDVLRIASSGSGYGRLIRRWRESSGRGRKWTSLLAALGLDAGKLAAVRSWPPLKQVRYVNNFINDRILYDYEAERSVRRMWALYRVVPNWPTVFEVLADGKALRDGQALAKFALLRLINRSLDVRLLITDKEIRAASVRHRAVLYYDPREPDDPYLLDNTQGVFRARQSPIRPIVSFNERTSWNYLSSPVEAGDFQWASRGGSIRIRNTVRVYTDPDNGGSPDAHLCSPSCGLPKGYRPAPPADAGRVGRVAAD